MAGDDGGGKGSPAGDVTLAATIDIEKPAKDVLSEWGYGMGRIAGFHPGCRCGENFTRHG